MSDLVIRQMTKADIDTAMSLKKAEGWNQTEADWEFLLHHNPELCLVGSVGNLVVGTVTAISYDNHLSWIGMMLVDRNQRNLGIGTKLFQKLLERLQGCGAIKLDASPAGNPIYRKFGFVEEFELQRLIADKLQPSRFFKSDSQIRKIQDSDVEKVIEIDRNVFGIERRELIRFLFQSRGEGGYLAIRNERVVGILGQRLGSLYKQLGPVYAETKDVALALVSKAFQEVGGKPITVDIQSGKAEFRDWLLRMGFKEQRPFHRMYLEKNPHPGSVDQQYAITSPELG